jgi:hypothetical protein
MMDYAKMTKAQLVKKIKELQPLEWRSLEAHNYLDEVFGVLVLIRESKALTDCYAETQALNGAMTLIFKAQNTLEGD